MTSPTPASTEVKTPLRFRLDVEGLRALAVGFVLLHHASATLMPGGFAGVDMFFVVSGFVITTQLVREVERTGTVNLPSFYARRAKRLLPAAGMVLVFTALSTWAFASRVQWASIGTDIVASSLYVVNWVFAARSVDYLAEDIEPSPVQHFWSLAVEEQFYFIWPLLIMGLALLARRIRHLAKSSTGERSKAHSAAIPLRAVLALGLLMVVVIPSLAWSIYYTSTSPQQAYFVTTTRLWELGVGALVAVLAPTWQLLSRRIAALLGWLGLIGLLISMIFITTQTAWPGSAALVPTLSTALVIIAGFSAAEIGPIRVLGIKPLVWIGGLSYSLYLWHWPLLRAGEWVFGEQGPYQGLAIVAFSFLPAWAGYHLIEKPIRFSKSISKAPKLSLSIGANFTAIGVVAGLVLSGAAASSSDQGPQNAAVATGSGAPLFPTITPDPTQATTDLPNIYEMGCPVSLQGGEVVDCPSPVAGTGSIDVVLVGDSKIGQWTSTVEAIALENDWSVSTYTMSGCSYADVLLVKEAGDYVPCRNWAQDVHAILTEDPPDILLTSGVSRSGRAADGSIGTQPVIDGMITYWQEMVDAGTVVFAISDTPQPPSEEDYGYASVYECVADNMDNPSQECEWPALRGPGDRVLEPAAEAVDGATFIDMNAEFCVEGTCPAVYRNVLTYRQGSHITDTFAQVLAPQLREELLPLLPELASP